MRHLLNKIGTSYILPIVPTVVPHFANSHTCVFFWVTSMVGNANEAMILRKRF